MDLLVNTFGSFVAKRSLRIKVKTAQNTSEFPIEQVDALLIASSGVAISADALRLLVHYDKPVAFLDDTGEAYARLSGIREQSAVSLRRAQWEALRNGRGLSLVQAILNGKIRSQAATLRYLSKSRIQQPDLHRRLNSLAEEILAALPKLLQPGPDLPAARNTLFAIEAAAGRAYWEGIGAILPPESHFPGRIRHGATDPVNSALNYGYGILTAKVWSAVVISGLDPYLGFLHALQDGRPSFVFDVIELFRQVTVDRPILGWLGRGGRVQHEPNHKLHIDTRRQLAELVLGRFNATIPYHGRDERLQNVVAYELRAISHHLRTGRPYRPFAGAW